MDAIGAIIFAVVVILSIAQKLKEQSDLKRAQRQQGSAPLSPTAPRQAAAKKPSKQPPARELLEALLGVEIPESEEEAEWAAEVPAQRREIRRPQQATAPPPIQRRSSAQQSPLKAQRRGQAVDERQELQIRRQRKEDQQRRNEAQQYREQEQRARQQRGTQQTARRSDAKRVAATAPTRRQKRERLFGGKHEVRKAIVFAEILGPPKAFENPQGNQQAHQGV